MHTTQCATIRPLVGPTMDSEMKYISVQVCSSTGKMCAMQMCIIIWLGKWNWYILKNWKRCKERLSGIHCAAFIGGRMLMYLIPFNETVIYPIHMCVHFLHLYDLRFANGEHNNSLCLWPWQKPRKTPKRNGTQISHFSDCERWTSIAHFFLNNYLQCSAFEYCQMIFCLQSINI